MISEYTANSVLMQISYSLEMVKFYNTYTTVVQHKILYKSKYSWHNKC